MIPWNERVTAISINPEMAKISDIARMADDLMRCRRELYRLADVVGEDDYKLIMKVLKEVL
jgi:hypothetical protein